MCANANANEYLLSADSVRKLAGSQHTAPKSSGPDTNFKSLIRIKAMHDDLLDFDAKLSQIADCERWKMEDR